MADAFYSGTVRVITSRPEVFVLRKTKREGIEPERVTHRASVSQKKSRRVSVAYVITPQKTAYSFTQPEKVFVLVRSVQTTLVHTASDSVVAQRKTTTV